MVILSHLHFDHAGGLLPTYQELEQNGERLLFPTAEYVVGKQAWERALKPHSRDRASFVPVLNRLLEESGRLKLINPESDQLLGGKIKFVTSSGHTPGQIHTVISDESGRSAFFAGDLIPGRHWVHVPITMGYDRYPEMLIDEKSELYKTALAEKWLILYTHDSEYSSSYIKQDEKGRYTFDQPIESLSSFEM